MRITKLAGALLVGCVAIAPLAAHAADNYPARPITLIVPFPAGGVTDIVGREVANNLSKSLGQTVVVENRAGAGGDIGTHAVAQAASDGYTLGILTVSAMSIGPHIKKNLNFSPDTDFTPITNVVTTPGAIIAHIDTPYNSLPELIDYAQSHPGKVSYASVGTGSIPHLTAEMFSQRTKTEMQHVPYRGAAPALQDLLAGHINLSFETSLVSTMNSLGSGRMKVLAITAGERSASLPEIPTVAESGYPGFSAQGWFGLFGPANLPAEIVEKLNEATTTALRDPEVIERLARQGTVPMPTTQDEFVAFLKEENDKWAAIANSLDLQLD